MRASARSTSFFRALERPGRAQDGGGVAGHTQGPRGPESRLFQAIHGRRAARLVPEVSSSRRKRTGFAAHGEIIADGPQNGKGRGRANGPLKRAEINAEPVKSPIFGGSITAIGAGRGVTRCYFSRADAGPQAASRAVKRKNSPGSKVTFPPKRCHPVTLAYFKGFRALRGQVEPLKQSDKILIYLLIIQA